MYKNKNITEVEKMIELYRDGKSLKEIGEIFGISRQAIQQRLQRVGFNIMDEKKALLVKKNKQWKALADEVLIESCNRKVKDIWDKKRYAETRLLQIKQSRIKLIDGYTATLNEILKLYQLSLKDKRTQSLVLKEINEVVKKQLREFSEYKSMMNE